METMTDPRMSPYGRPDGIGRWGSEGRWRAVIVAVVAVVLVGGLWMVRRNRALDSALATASRFTLGQEPSESRTEFERASRPDIYFRVRLSSAPVGRTLRLDCAWTDPSGAVVRQNHYETREITTDPWETHCHQAFGQESTGGVWRVALTRGGRVLREDSFGLR